MTPSAIRKAALLLVSLDPGTAAELLKAAQPAMVAEIAAELVYLGATGQRDDAPRTSPLEEFCGLIRGKTDRGGLEPFIRQMLAGAVGERESKELLTEVRRRVDARDPFIPIRGADADTLAQALQGENPQIVALVLSELAPDKSAALLALLDETTRTEAVRRMTAAAPVSPEARARVAAIVRQRLTAVRAKPGEEAAARPQGRLRRVALLLRGVKTDLRNNLVKTIAEQDAETAKTVQNLMVQWQDIPLIAERCLQETLRDLESKQLALALVGADAATEKKVRANISERASAMIDEERSLMKSPKEEETEAARETILGGLRQLNEKGDLQFEEA